MKFCPRSSLPVDAVGEVLEYLLHQGRDLFRIEGLAHRGVPGDVGEEDGDLPALALDVPGRDHLVGEPLWNVAVNASQQLFGVRPGVRGNFL